MTRTNKNIRLGMLWQGLDLEEAVEAFRTKYGSDPVLVAHNPAEEVEGAESRHDIPNGHLWLELPGDFEPLRHRIGEG